MVSRKPSDVIRYVTVRILSSLDGSENWSGSGTGFMYLFKRGENTFPAIITNRHVIDDIKRIGITFHITEDGNTSPVPGPGKIISLGIEDIYYIFHPNNSIDLVMIALSPIMDYAKYNLGYDIYVQCLHNDYIPSCDDIKNLSSIEDIIMAGYPNNISDTENNFPIVRKGITATPLSSNYKGQKVFLIDMAIYGGSSGSPVFLITEGSWMNNGEMKFGVRFFLLGVLYAGHIRNSEHMLQIKKVPTYNGPYIKIEEMLNLGLCIKSEIIEEFSLLI